MNRVLVGCWEVRVKLPSSAILVVSLVNGPCSWAVAVAVAVGLVRPLFGRLSALNLHANLFLQKTVPHGQVTGHFRSIFGRRVSCSEQIDSKVKVTVLFWKGKWLKTSLHSTQLTLQKFRGKDSHMSQYISHFS